MVKLTEYGVPSLDPTLLGPALGHLKKPLFILAGVGFAMTSAKRSLVATSPTATPIRRLVGTKIADLTKLAAFIIVPLSSVKLLLHCRTELRLIARGIPVHAAVSTRYSFILLSYRIRGKFYEAEVVFGDARSDGLEMS
jgi:hypothetical protein